MPTEKPALNKQFKIYRWNPDEPAKKPELQTYNINLNECGPMVCISLLFAHLPAAHPLMNVWF